MNSRVQTVAASYSKSGLSGKQMLSAAAGKYIRLMADPASQALIGIPNTPVLDSNVARVFMRGSFTTGATTGLGYIVVSPLAAAVNDNTCLLATSSASAGTSISTASVAGDQAISSNSTYATADIGLQPLAQYRVVASELRIKSITAPLTRGGDFVGLMVPDHSALDGVNSQQMKAFEESATFSPGMQDDWYTLLYRPVRDDDYQFNQTVVNITSPANGGFMGFIVTAPAAASPQTYDYEFYVVIEYQGSKVRNKVPSLADPIGHDAAQTVLLAGNKLKKPHLHDPELAQKAHFAVEHVARHHMTHGGDHGKSEDEGPSNTINSILTGVARVGGGLLSGFFGI
jgi:hypothetical protein